MREFQIMLQHLLLHLFRIDFDKEMAPVVNLSFPTAAAAHKYLAHFKMACGPEFRSMIDKPDGVTLNGKPFLFNGVKVRITAPSP